MSWPVLYGHEAVWQRLVGLLDSGRLPHAVLLTGAAGIGKVLLAQRLMARLACTGEPGPRGDGRPCGECPGCRQMAAGSHPDLFALSAPDRRKETRKKEIGIEQARNLKRFAQLHAIAAPRKMALVDDADRLSLAAQNALLKTLEEPPGQALIILVTAAPGALLPTVRSRCQRVLCRPLTTEQVQSVLTGSGIAADEATALASAADGSPGAALTLRTTWREDERREVEDLLADLQAGRYGSVLAMSKGLGSSETDTAARLDGLFTLCRASALEAAASGDSEALYRAVRRADAVAEAQRTLRWRNPNRALLTEALALRLARS
jgi:DNA polymerase III subunit delta'